MVLSILDDIDRRASNAIHKLDLVPPLDQFVTLCGYIFNRPPLFFPYAIMLCFGVPYLEKQYTSPIFYLSHYVQCLLTVLVITTLSKKVIKRPRPVAPNMIKRSFDLRGFEFNNSMPSGDTAQAALLYLMLCKISTVAILYSSMLFLLVPLVALGRVYHHCHWIGDTIVGAAIGYAVFMYSPHLAHDYF